MQHTRHFVPSTDLDQRWRCDFAFGTNMRAARGEAAAGGGIDELGHRARNRLQPLLVRRREVHARYRAVF